MKEFQEALESMDRPEWIDKRLILVSRTGSQIYGTSLTPEEDPEGEGSDVDYRGICIPPKEYFVGLGKFTSFDNTGGKNFRSTHKSKDVAILHITKFVWDAMEGVPNNIELLYADPSNHEVINHFGWELITHRNNFLSKKGILKKFGGYANGQKHRMEHQSSREKLIEKFGYDVKFGGHAVRLLTMATEILTDGTMTLPCQNAELLRQIRMGKFTLKEMKEMIDHYDAELGKAYEKSSLPELPDMHKINKWLCDINERAIGGEW